MIPISIDYYAPDDLPRIRINTKLGIRIRDDAEFEASLLDALRAAHAAGNYPTTLTIEMAEQMVRGDRS